MKVYLKFLHEKKAFTNAQSCISVSSGDSWLRGIPSSWQPALQPGWLCGPWVRRQKHGWPAAVAWCCPYGGHSHSSWRALGKAHTHTPPTPPPPHTHTVYVLLNCTDDFFVNLYMISQGVTFKVEGGDLVIARILHGGMIDQQGLLHVGDVIKEVRLIFQLQRLSWLINASIKWSAIVLFIGLCPVWICVFTDY